MQSEEIGGYARLLRTIAHPIRLMILAKLMKGTKCVSDIRDLLEVSQPNVSQHLAVLKEKRLVACRKQGVSRCYYLARPRFVRELLVVLKGASAERTAGEPGRKRTAAAAGRRPDAR